MPLLVIKLTVKISDKVASFAKNNAIIYLTKNNLLMKNYSQTLPEQICEQLFIHTICTCLYKQQTQLKWQKWHANSSKMSVTSKN